MHSLAKVSLFLLIILLVSSPAWAIPRNFEMAGSASESSARGFLDCTNIMPLSCGDVVTGDNGPDGNVDEFGCYAMAPWSGEDVYEIELVEGAQVLIDIEVEPPYMNYVFILASCDEMDCLAVVEYGNMIFSPPYTGTYFFVVDTYGYGGLPYTLSVECNLPEPPPENDTCFNGACLPPATDGSFAGNLFWTVDDMDFGLACGLGIGVTADVVYEFALEDGDSFSATVSSDANTDITLAITTDCEDPDACVHGMDIGSPGQPETIEWTNTTGELTLYYLIVKDYIRTQAGIFTGVYTHNGVYCDDPIGTTTSTWGSVKALYK